MNVMGSTKVDVAVDGIREMVQANGEAYGDVKVEEVIVVVELSYDRDRETGASTGKMVWACSDSRRWVQRAFLQEAADMCLEADTFAEEEDE